jgi:YjbE family integral membrane protein
MGLAGIWSYARIILIDIVLAGDNAVVIAMAARTLAGRQRTQAIMLGAMAAIVIRVAVTIVVSHLLRVPFLSAVGGALVLWIAAKLLVEDVEVSEAGHHAKSFWHAIWLIAVADFIMSTDNMLAVAGAAEGHDSRILFGLALSIPIIMFCSSLIARLMDRYRWLADMGAGVLGWTGGKMVVDDARVALWLGNSSAWAHWTVPALCAVGVVLIGRWWARAHRRRGAETAPDQGARLHL